MENETYIPDDYDELLTQYRRMKNDLNELKQNLYETSRQLKVNEGLLTEYQSDIELLQEKEQLHNEKFEAKIVSLEETIATLRSGHSENISYLETELEKKEKENDDLKSQLELLKRRNAVEVPIDVSTNSNEIIALTNENDELRLKIHEMEEAFEHLRSSHSKLEESLEECKEELSQVKENLAIKKDELSENSTLIDKLYDDLLCANKELENYKHKPLEADSKGNSLFAEVDDRRVHLQETINQMKSSYIHLKQEHGQHVKLISQLRKENADLRESWKKDLEEIQEDKYWVNDTLKRHVEVLEALLEQQKKQLEEQSIMEGDDLPRDFKFYNKMIDDKSREIEKWKKKYQDKSINEHLMSVNLAEANKKVRLARLELQRQAEELKESKAHYEIQEKAQCEVLCHKCETDKENQRKSRKFEIDSRACVTQNRVAMKSCLKSKEAAAQLQLESDLSCLRMVFNNAEKETKHKLFSGDVTPYTITHRRKLQSLDEHNINEDIKENVRTNISPNTTEDLISFVNKENIDLNNTPDNIDTTHDNEKRGVTFSEDTVDPPGNPARRRGTRVFIVKKKDDIDN